ncbi:MAG TPA: PAS domain S-box protein [Polyangiaceae bacterium]|nr:PAS domain S-box protein [Polyangiaceae bacterium]
MRRSPRAWTADEVALAQEAAGRVWSEVERARAEAALRASEARVRASAARYQALFTSIDEGYCVVRVLVDDAGRPRDYVFEEVNGAFERQTGILGPVGRSMREIAPAHEEHWFEIYGRIARTGRPERFENVASALGRWFDVYAFRLGEPEERRVAILFSDVTARREAEAALRRSEQHLRENERRQRFLLTLSDALRPLADPAEVQRVACEAIGEGLAADRVNYAEVEGDEYAVLREYRRPGLASMAGRYPIDSFRPAERAAFEAGRTVALADILAEPGLSAGEAAAYGALGVRAFVSVPLRKEGRLRAVLGVIRSRPGDWRPEEVSLVEEVAERTWSAVEHARAEAALRASEERMRRAIAVPGVGVLFFRLDGTMSEANEAFQRMSGYTLDELRTTAHWSELTAPAYHDVTRRRAADLAERGETAPYEKEMVRKDGTRWWGLFAPTRLSGSGPASECVEFAIDITDAKRAERALQASEARFRALASSAPSVLFRMSPDGSAMDRLGGQGSLPDAQEAREDWLDEYVHPDDRPAVLEAIREAVRDKRVFELEHRVRLADGGLGWTLSRAVPVLDEGGAIVEWVGQAVDVTAKKRAGDERRRARDEVEARVAERTAELRASEERFRALVEASAQAVWTTDAEGRVVDDSPSWRAFTGQTPDERLGWGWLDAVHPDDRKGAERQWRAAVARGSVFDARLRLRHAPGGSWRTAHLRAVPLRSADGAVRGWVGMNTDLAGVEASNEPSLDGRRPPPLAEKARPMASPRSPPGRRRKPRSHRG